MTIRVPAHMLPARNLALYRKSTIVTRARTLLLWGVRLRRIVVAVRIAVLVTVRDSRVATAISRAALWCRGENVVTAPKDAVCQHT